MDKRLTLLVLSLMVAICMFAQGNATQSINEIKRQGDIYLYAESTSQTWEEALDYAKKTLGDEIENWVRSLETPPADGYIAEAQNHIFNIKSMRGSYFRAFVYVKKTDVVPYANASQLVVVPISKEQETTISKVSSTQKETISNQEITIYRPSLIEQEMLTITDANNIVSYINRLKSENKVVKYGKFIDMPQDIDCYLFVIDRKYNVVAYIKKQGLSYTHIATGLPADINEYKKNYGAYWFQLK